MNLYLDIKDQEKNIGSDLSKYNQDLEVVEVAKLSPLLVKKRSVDDLTSDTEEIDGEKASQLKKN